MTYYDFKAASNWATFDPGANGVGADADGYIGGVFDGRYLYLVPYHNGRTIHGDVLRFLARDPPAIPPTVYGGSFF